MAILATNLAKNIDPAFIRRLHVVVEFPYPGRPSGAGSGPDRSRPAWPWSADLDFDALAEEFELSGGAIFNAVLGSAFLAAEAGTPITMDLAVAALRREMQKMGRLVTDQSFSRFAEGS